MTPQITTEIVEVLRQCEVDLTEAGNIITGTGLRATGGLMHASAERLRALLSRLEAKGREDASESPAGRDAQARGKGMEEALRHLFDLYNNEPVPTPEHAVALEAARAALAPRNDTGGKEEKAT